MAPGEDEDRELCALPDVPCASLHLAAASCPLSHPPHTTKREYVVPWPLGAALTGCKSPRRTLHSVACGGSTGGGGGACRAVQIMAVPVL